MSTSTAEISPPALDTYLRTAVAPRFSELVRGVEQRLESAHRELDDLRSATGTIAWEVPGAAPAVAYVNIADGMMNVGERPATAPFMTVSQSAADWARFTGGMAGLFGGDSRRPFGRSRIDRVRAINGAIRFVLTGMADGGAWSCTLYFGPGPRPAEPQTTVTIAADVVQKIQAGQLDPQMAFMQGQLKMSGDPGLAMQLGMALFL